MTEQDCRDALGWKQKADKLRQQLDEYVLLKRDSYVKEVVCLGDPVRFKQNDYHRVEVPLSDALRRYAFRLWKRETTMEYNEACRKMAQLGLQTDHCVRPLPESQPAQMKDRL